MEKIQMLETVPGRAPVGHSVKLYEKGQVYDVPSDMAGIFCDDMKVAKRVTSSGSEEKTEGPAPENKAEKAAPENKAKGGRRKK